MRPAALMLTDPLKPLVHPHHGGSRSGGCPRLPQPPIRSAETISVFAPMVLRLSRGDNTAARPSMGAWIVAAADRVRVRCQSPAVA
jgi:hypothetical protein